MFTLTVTPRFGDIDGLGHINNTVLPGWFETARNPIFRIFTPDLDLGEDKWKLIMVRMEFDFLGEMFFDGDVEIKTYILKIGNTSFTIGHEAWQHNKLKVRGKAVIVHYDFKEEMSIPIQGECRKRLESHLVPENNTTWDSIK
ncbi:acyl-CoA thioesterase [Methanosalsum natronophilum]|uniref:acyl-CoA thioesterase n=1 Tax=Methanosalsum natronophilum TaxID=768733 RepID=UPI0021691BD8|nr:thioesterase family protein [Methanosalsum natronophilum]MCS3924306.1 acyl-CoA thioester hydrolase [Methanosalsum natronophilum]